MPTKGQGMKSNSRAKRERRTARREELLRRLEETLIPLPDGAADHMKSISEESGRGPHPSAQRGAVPAME